MSAKNEPWFKPRPDEEADDAMLDWLGGGSRKPPDPPKKSGGFSCFSIAAPVLATLAAIAALLLA